MFDLFDGLPVHVLVVHAVVVLAPLTALLAVAYALAPRTRLGLRRPLAALAVLTGVTGFVAGESGEKLEHRLGNGGEAAVHAHAEAGDLLKVLCVLFMLLVLASVLALLKPHRPEPLAGGHDGGRRGVDGSTRADTRRAGHAKQGPLALITAAVLTLASLGVVYQTLATGHSGARAVWSDRVTPTP
ncbi:DUF2231 domain-containing protein [Arsenicicoccus dermatophilus]|uniref:DUF2231 domain-containing protein n=1 Tax=Arsenicicoccus dermatophilus TaxID=1076331 RepID=UPI001F4CA0DC|nr:DUF2231 domain-containing protein [Arsenicicoccus dermatophilus]MCH8611618.1 hypothetical protein [Arsenicicoccus dermatophilus]